MEPTDTSTSQSPHPEYMKLKEFLSLNGISATTYRKLRKQGVTPTEVRLSKRMILIKRSEATSWLDVLHAKSSQPSTQQQQG